MGRNSHSPRFSPSFFIALDIFRFFYASPLSFQAQYTWLQSWLIFEAKMKNKTIDNQDWWQKGSITWTDKNYAQ
jgi:hypothetical protein